MCRSTAPWRRSLWWVPTPEVRLHFKLLPALPRCCFVPGPTVVVECFAVCCSHNAPSLRLPNLALVRRRLRPAPPAPSARWPRAALWRTWAPL